MSSQHTVAFFVAMNEDGDFWVTTEQADAFSESMKEIGGEAFRVVRINVTMTAPEIPEINVTAPDDAGEESASVA